jgi:hypothetical protein
VEQAILRTVLYADIFDYALTPEEIHLFLIDHNSASLEQIQRALVTSTFLNQHLWQSEEFIVMTGREHLVPLRKERTLAAQHLWPRAMRYGTWLARLPFVRMVALTGALAMRNSPDTHDDLDYIVVTKPGRVWLARAFAVLLVRLVRLRGSEICPNYVVSENRLAQSRRDLFIAHEIVQMIPVYGTTVYQRLLDENRWLKAFLPNAHNSPNLDHQEATGNGWKRLKQLLEFTLGGRVGDAIENWEFRRKFQRFSPEAAQSQSAAEIDAETVKGHFVDNGNPILHQYYERLCEYGLADEDPAIATMPEK